MAGCLLSTPSRLGLCFPDRESADWMELTAGMFSSIPPKLSPPRHVTSAQTGIIFGSNPDKAIIMASDYTDRTAG